MCLSENYYDFNRNPRIIKERLRRAYALGLITGAVFMVIVYELTSRYL